VRNMAVQRYEIYKDVAGKFRFRLRATNNKIVAVGEAYETKDGCLNGVHAIKKYCGAEIEDLTTGEANIANPKFQVYKDAAEKYRFRLRAPNNEIVAVGEAYESKFGCMSGVQGVKKYCDAEVKDLTMEQILEEPARGPPKEAVIGDLTAGETTLILDRPPSKALKGSIVTFTGRLVSEGEGVAGAKIDIYESDRSFMKDDYMASGHTLKDGTFIIDWKAKETDWWDNTVEVYAKFEGEASHKPSRSKQYVITVWSSKILGGSQI
jgi:uncharacterized protein YegP (UPF0339 family)